MPERPDALAGARDVLLVVFTVVLAFGLGAVSAHVGAGAPSGNPAFNPAVSPAPGQDAEHDHTRIQHAAPRVTAANPEVDAETSAAALRTAREEAANQRMADNLRDRFSGAGAGRKEAHAGRDSNNPRSFILETASSIHRRRWIGLSARVGAEPADVSVYPRSARSTAEIE